MSISLDMSERSPAVNTATFAPAPLLERGFNMHLSATKRGDLLVYCNGRTVFLRDLNDMTKVRVFAEHKCRATVARFSPNGRHVASGDVEGNLLIWEVLSDRFSLRKTFPINKGIKDIAWSEDGQRIAVCGASEGGSYAKAILVDSGNTVGELSGNTATVLSCDYKPTRPFRVATGGEDRKLCFFEGPPFKFNLSNTDHQNYITTVRFSPDGTTLLSTGNDMKVIFYDAKEGTKTGELKQGPKLQAHSGTLYSASWSPDSKQILTASADKSTKLWTVADSTLVATWKFGADIKKPEIEDMQMSTLWHKQDAKTGGKDFLISVSLTGAFNFLDPANVAAITSVHGVMKNIKSLVLDTDNQSFYVGESTGVITKFDLVSGAAKWLSGKNSGSAVNTMRLAPGNKLQVINLDDKVRVHDATALERADDKKAEPVVLGGCAKADATANTNKAVWAVVTANQKLVIFHDHKIVSTTALSFEPYCVTFHPDDSLIYVGGKNKAAVAFSHNIATGAVTWTDTKYETHDVCEQVTVTSDGKFICAADRKRSLNVFDVASGNLLNTSDPLRYHTASLRSVAYSPNGSKLLSAAMDSMVYIWYDGVIGARRLKIEAHTQGISHAAWLNETTIITVGEELTVKTWTVPDTWA